MRLIIGTAQFTGKYGINSYKKKIIKINYLNKIYLFAKENNIKFIDTAQSYDGVEKLIGQSKLSKLKVITKIHVTKNLNKKDIYIDFIKTLKKLNKRNIYALLLHNPENLNIQNIKSLLSFFRQIKKEKLVKKVGISIYEKKDLKMICKFWIPEIVQLPINILNRNLYNDKTINYLKINKVEIHARSIFLQGLLLSKKNYAKFSNWSELLSTWDFITKGKTNLKIFYSIKFIQKLTGIKNFVLGFDNLSQLKLIIKSLKKNIKFEKKLNNFFSKDKLLIDPRKWRQ